MSNKLDIYACSGVSPQYSRENEEFSQTGSGLQVNAEMEVRDDPDSGFSLVDSNGLQAGTNNQQKEDDPGFSVVGDDSDGLQVSTDYQEREDDPGFRVVNNDTDGLQVGTDYQEEEDDPGFRVVNTDPDGLRANTLVSERWEHNEVLVRQDLWIANEVKDSLVNSGWEENKTLRKYLSSSNNGGCAEYFLYLFIPEDLLPDYSAAVIRKRKLQKKTYDYVLSIWTDLNYGTEQELQSVIVDGIEETFEAPIDLVLEDIRTGKREGIGIATEIVVAIISAIVSIVLAVVTGVVEYCKTKAAAKYTAPSYSELQASVPESTDIIGNGKSTNNTTWLWLAAGVGALMLFLGKGKK